MNRTVQYLVRPPLPCPFCGHSPEVSHGKVRCKHYGCPIQPKSVAWWDKDHHQSAIDDWNRRPNATNHAPTERSEVKLNTLRQTGCGESPDGDAQPPAIPA